MHFSTPRAKGLVCLALLVGCSSANQVRPRLEPPPCVDLLCHLGESSPEERAEPQSADGQSWQTTFSSSFRILHHDARLAAEVGRTAEEQRLRLLRLWSGASNPPPWNPRCDIYLYPDPAALREIGVPARSGAKASPSLLEPGAIVSRKIVAVASDPELLTEVVPHELGHLVITELLGVRRMPLWAAEGFAVLAGSEKVITMHRRALARLLGANRPRYALQELLAMTRYPAGPRGRFYGQSFSLARFLLTLRDRPTLLAFWRQIADSTEILAALEQHYAISSFEELERRWVEFGVSDAP